jgi:2-polyprenyl-3-methyl-5-hydroxy-6-metoxy-1,4-benzoquinol methylase
VRSDAEWQEWGAKDPYYGVLTDSKYRGKELASDAREEFFASGRQHIAAALKSCETYFGSVSTARCLDFGCGVGRLLLPLAEDAEYAVGVDIAQSMLDEAKRNSEELGLKNVALFRTLDQIPENKNSFTFIHTYIALQHVDPSRGYQIIKDLLARLEKGGCAALHVTYARGRFVSNMGAEPLLVEIAKSIRLSLRRLRRRLSGRGDPEMQMHCYDMNKVLFLIQNSGVRNGGLQFTDHRTYGVTLFLRRD